MCVGVICTHAGSKHLSSLYLTCTVYNKSVHALRRVFGELSTNSLFSVSKQDADEYTYDGCVCCAEAKLLLVSVGFVVNT